MESNPSHTLPYSFEERLLVKVFSSSSSSSSSTSSATSTKTVRLESLAQWKDDSWIHPFSDIDLGLSSSSTATATASESNLRRHYGGKIAKVEMGVSSHGTRGGFPNHAEGLDGIPLLKLKPNHRDNHKENDRYPSLPQGFSLSVRPFAGLTPGDEARAVQAIFEELIRTRLLVTPVTGGEWDVLDVEDENEDESESEDDYGEENFDGDEGMASRLSPRLYHLTMPFDGASWSSDALTQSFRGTLPGVCQGSSNDDDEGARFFGWSAKEWSDFLVGYKDGGGTLGKGSTRSQQDPTFHKSMWWIWTAGLPTKTSGIDSNSNSKNGQGQGLSFGIQYQTIVPFATASRDRDWIPDAFRESAAAACPIGKRTSFKVLPASKPGSYRLVPLTANANADGSASEPYEAEAGVSHSFLHSHSVSIDQVLRRHHTDRGRFESKIELTPLDAYRYNNNNNANTNNDQDQGSRSCRMVYRQVFPDFLTPLWRTLRVVDVDGGDPIGVVHENNQSQSGASYFYTNNADSNANADRLRTWVEWNPERQSSVFFVEATATPTAIPGVTPEASLSLPSTVIVSLEYAPTFLTMDDFPGDPNRGRVLPPARVAVRCEGMATAMAAGTLTPAVVVYSNALLLLPPVPDLSMPFNVISVTCSLYAYAIGAIVTILVRKASEKIKHKLYPDTKPEPKAKQLKRRIRETIDRVRSSSKLVGSAGAIGTNGKDGVDERHHESSDRRVTRDE